MSVTCGVRVPEVADAATQVERQMRAWLEVKVDATGQPVRGWGDELGEFAWQWAPGLVWRRATRTCGSLGIARLEFDWEYGPKMWDIDYGGYVELTKEVDHSDTWIRLVRPVEADGSLQYGNVSAGAWPRIELWKGQIAEPLEEIHGDEVENAVSEPRPAGKQRWAAYGPERVLERARIDGSWWLRDGAATPYKLDAVPDVNIRNGQPGLIGNRSGHVDETGVYCFGGDEEWTAWQFLEYLIVKFVMRRGVSADSYYGPIWCASGLLSALRDFQPRIDMTRFRGADRNVYTLLRELVPPERALDWTLDDVTGGFGLHVFGLLGQGVVAGGERFPANRDRTTLDISDSDRILCQVARSLTPRCDRIRLEGDFARVVLCLGSGAANLSGTLDRGWDDDREDDFLDGGGEVDAQLQDAARASEKYADVYSCLVANLNTFDFNGGLCNPTFDADGDVSYDDGTRYQLLERSTEESLPLKVGTDYTQNPPDDLRPAAQAPEYLPPFAVVKDLRNTKYVMAEKLQALRPDLEPVEVAPAAQALGIFLRCAHQHLFARDEWGAGGGETTTPWNPQYDGLRWQDVIAVISTRTDHRVSIEAEVPDLEKAGDGSLQIVPVPIAQFWLLPANTVVGADDDGTLLRSPGVRILLRDDRNLLRAMLPGALGRYLRQRQRAVITEFDTIAPYQYLVGSMLDLEGEQGELEEILTPVSTVEWIKTQAGEGYRVRTEVYTGHATARGGRM